MKCYKGPRPWTLWNSESKR